MSNWPTDQLKNRLSNKLPIHLITIWQTDKVTITPNDQKFHELTTCLTGLPVHSAINRLSTPQPDELNIWKTGQLTD